MSSDVLNRQTNPVMTALCSVLFGALLLFALPEKAMAQETGDLLMNTYPSTDFTGTPITTGPVSTIDQTNLNPGGRGNFFSVRVEGYIYAETTGTYSFETYSDDGVRLFVDSNTVINNYGRHAPTINTGSIDLVAGNWYPILLEHYEWGGGQRLRLRWREPGAASYAFPPKSALSQTLPAMANNPFATQEGRVGYVITEEAARSLRAEIAANQRANQDARSRHATAMRCRALREEDAVAATDVECADEAVSRNTPLGFDGSLTATSASTKFVGDFFGQRGLSDGGTQSLYFGDIEVTRFDGGDVSAVFSARYAREKMVDDMLFGYFVGLSLTHSNLRDVVDGSRTGYGLSTGAYVVDQLNDTLTWDGFLSVGAGRNNLDIRDGSDDISGDYNTRSVLMGVALSGSRSYDAFDLRPEVNLSLGYTDIGNVALTGGSSPIVDAGGVTLGRVSFEPDFVFPFDTSGTRFDTNELWVTPSVTCEYQETTSSDTACGGGLALEWSASAGNGLHDLSVRISREVLDNDVRDSIGFQIESVF